jgi:PAS domain S-box-containing protein
MSKKRFVRVWLNSLKVQLWCFFGLALLGIMGMLFLNIRLYQLYQAQDRALGEVYAPAERYRLLLRENLDQNLNLWRENAQFVLKEELSQQKANTKLTFEEIWQKNLLPHRDSLRKIIENDFQGEGMERFQDIQLKIKKIFTASQRTLQDIDKAIPQTFFSLNMGGPSSSSEALQGFEIAKERLSLQILPLTQEAQDMLQQLEEYLNIQAASQRQWLQYQETYIWTFQIIGVILFVLLFFMARAWIERHFSTELQKINTFGAKLQEGNLPENIQTSHRELAEIAHKLNQIKQSLKNLKDFAEDIHLSKANTSDTFFEKSGELGIALQNMKESLFTEAQETENRLWANEGITFFSEIIRQNAHNLDQLADAIVSNLSEYLKVNQVGFFVVAEGNPPKADYLEMKAAYAYNRKKYLDKTIELGQGLVGQAWQEAEPMYLKTVPADYTMITSGLGEATPSTLLIMPLRANQQIQGMIELASFHEIEPYQIDFVENIAQSIGQAISSLRTNLKTQNLLSDSQALTQDLQSKEEQMRESMQQLQDTQNRMYRTQQELANKEANLEGLINNTSHAILAYDVEYNITVVNRAMRLIYRDLSVGDNLRNILSKENIEQYWQEYEQALEGKKFTILRQFVQNNQVVYQERNYNPIINEDKEVIGASVFIEDITEQKLVENRIKRTEANLTSLINDTEDLILALDKEYKLLIFNEVSQEVYHHQGHEIEQGVSIFEYTPAKQIERWKAFYDRALEGERFVEVIDSGKYPNKTYREFWFNPIRNEEEEITGLSIFSRDITESKKSDVRVRQLLLDSLEATESLKTKEDELKKTIASYEEKIKILESQLST